MSQIEWPVGKRIPAVGEVWRRKRNGRFVTITHVPTSGVAPEVHYDMGNGKDGYTWTGNWHATFELHSDYAFRVDTSLIREAYAAGRFDMASVDEVQAYAEFDAWLANRDGRVG